ncbi:hypothetical protein yc1106_04771 [Curvularia clavata]|uniref:Uncharacterized protein n=1 Tax=Curvularia clavata TaxID=95742 RepID=A0A9Q9DSA8_CURCL|nr:hypothetical protein yc1106_04771 [Curvularia clavata]
MKCPTLDVALNFILPCPSHRAKNAKPDASSIQSTTQYARLHDDTQQQRISPKISRGSLKTRPRHGRIPISRLQMSEAWSRIRAVSPIPTRSDNSTDSNHDHDSPDKRVRWGVVYTCEFDPRSARSRGPTDKSKRYY